MTAAQISAELRRLSYALGALIDQERLRLDDTSGSQQWPTTADAVDEAEQAIADAIAVMQCLRTLSATN